MEHQIIKLPKGKYLSEIEPFKTQGLYSDCIYHKEVPGCGITHYAVRYFKTDIIIILPNVPVIEEKELDHNKRFPKAKVLGVYKGVDVDDIKEYLLSDVQYKKILTTPEGFTDKILKAFDNLNELYENFFLLFDECERIITDVGYRGKIAAPIDQFFLFDRKAMVSATTIPFSDHRFENLKHCKIQPTYSYRKPMNLIATDSVLSSLRDRIKQLNSGHVCIFFNSVDGIYAAIKSLGIEATSKVFCAQDSVVRLMEKGYKRASSYMSADDLVQYNFFTSRYFSAVSIITSYKPDIIIVSDVIFAEHSMIDPHTESIQISGRFRNGFKSLTHITNFDTEIASMDKNDSLTYLKGAFDTYEDFKRSLNKSNNPGSRYILNKAIKDSPASAFYTNDKINSFMVDNFIHEERVKGYYQKSQHLQLAYAEKHKHFKVSYRTDKCLLTDSELLKLNKRQTKKEKYQIVFDFFEKWSHKNDNYVFPPEDLRNRFISKYKEIWEAHLYLTKEQFINTKLILSQIRKAVEKEKHFDRIKFLSKEVYKVFNEYKDYPEKMIKAELLKIYRREGITSRVGAGTIGAFFEESRSTYQGEHVRKLKARKFIG